ncbi:MAG TPA: hypothetical protein VFG72_12840 [Marmoricola sp.]|nr:hypothetical protein [Marmoricola sp.]
MVALVGLGLLLVDGSERAELSPDRSPAASADEEEAATAFLPDLRADLLAGDPQQLHEVAASQAARRELGALSANLDRLRVADLGLRYVDTSDTALSATQRERFGADAWVADVQLIWRFGDVDRAPSTLEVPLVLTWDGSEPAFVTARVADGRRAPLWWQARVAVRRTPTTLVVAAERERLAVLSRQAVTAVDTVRGTLRSWQGPLVVEAARTSEQFQRASGLPASSARAIAAVTTTTDGSGLRHSASHIYLNPPVFDPLGPQGQQIVVSHEATHVALDAATTSVPMWLSEGFADYVALVGSKVPVPVLASQIRRLVRDDGAPANLPGREELDGGNEDVGAWYEAAWLAAALIAEEYGEDALLELYRVTDEDGNTDRAFRKVLGSTEAEFVDAWRAELTRLAG